MSGDDFQAVVDMAVNIYAKTDEDFVLLINGGNRQDVMQAHFHLFPGDLISQKNLPDEQGIIFSPSDELFWSHIESNLHDMLQQRGISEKSFSMFVQFGKNTKPVVYFL